MTAPVSATPLGFFDHARQTLRLAVPVMLARVGLVILITVDTVMSGAAGGDTLADYRASLAPHITMLTVGIGLSATSRRAASISPLSRARCSAPRRLQRRRARAWPAGRRPSGRG